MWFLVTFELNDFIRVTSTQGDTKFEFEGLEEGKNIYKVSLEATTYELDLIDTKPSGDTLTYLNELNPSGFILLNHSTVLLRWDRDLSILSESLTKIFQKKDRYIIIPVIKITDSNFLPVHEMNVFIKAASQ